MENPNEAASATRETYLHEVTLRIQSQVSPLEAYESIHEMRDHLNSMAAAYEEIGMDPESAMKAAVSKFGEASQVGADLAGASNGFFSRQIGLPVAFLAHVAGMCLLGFALMFSIDVVFFLTHQESQIWVPGDLGFGSAAGVVVATLGWLSRRRARCFAWNMVCLLNVVIVAFMFQSFWDLKDVGMTAKILGSLSAGVYMLAFAASKSASFIKSRDWFNSPPVSRA